MPRLAANLTMMFNEVPFLERFDAAAKAGFKAVEYLFPYDYPAAEIKRRLDDAGLAQVLFNLPAGDWSKGDRGMTAIPGQQAAFRDGMKLALDYATALGCKLVHCMAGIPPAGTPHVEAATVYAANLTWAADLATGTGIKPIIEPINHRGMPGYHLHTLAQGAAVVAAIGPDRLGLQFDIFHCQITEGDITKKLEMYMPITDHIQLADAPDRHEPGTGEIAWDYVLQRVDALGYKGWIGCEYVPAGDTVAGLSWRGRFGL